MPINLNLKSKLSSLKMQVHNKDAKTRAEETLGIPYFNMKYITLAVDNKYYTRFK